MFAECFTSWLLINLLTSNTDIKTGLSPVLLSQQFLVCQPTTADEMMMNFFFTLSLLQLVIPSAFSTSFDIGVDRFM